MHPVRVYPERHSVAEGGRDGEHRVGAREGPAFCLRGKLAESGGPIGRLLEGLRRVQFYDQWSVKLAGQKDANGRVQRDPLVDDVRTVVIELALEALSSWSCRMRRNSPGSEFSMPRVSLNLLSARTAL